MTCRSARDPHRAIAMVGPNDWSLMIPILDTTGKPVGDVRGKTRTTRWINAQIELQD